MAAQGTATLDFGAFPGNTYAVVNVIGQGAILSTNSAESFFMADTTADHTDSDHIMTAALVSLVCGIPTNGIGFPIHAVAEQKLVGQFTIHWIWA